MDLMPDHQKIEWFKHQVFFVPKLAYSMKPLMILPYYFFQYVE